MDLKITGGALLLAPFEKGPFGRPMPKNREKWRTLFLPLVEERKKWFTLSWLKVGHPPA
jgi:hypothetical protein